MRVVFLNPTGLLGGAENSILDFMASLRNAKPEWALFLVAGDDGPLLERARSLGVGCTVVPLPRAVARLGDAWAVGLAPRRWLPTIGFDVVSAVPAACAYLRRLHAALLSLAPDLVHTSGLKMHLLGKWARPSGSPLLWHVHDYVSPRPVIARLMRHQWHEGIAVIANSKSVARDFEGLCGVEGIASTVYYGIDLDAFAPEGQASDLDGLSGLPPAPPGTVRVGLIATLARWKGHAVFLKALSLLARELPVRGYVVGGGIYRTKGSQHTLEELRSLAASLGLEGRVGFTGFCEKPHAAMRALDVVVHASTQPEPFGRVIVEAMACARPVVVSLAGGPEEIVTDGADALAFSPGDAEGLARRIESLATDPGLRARLGRAGRATAELRFSRKRLAADLIPIYEGLVNGR